MTELKAEKTDEPLQPPESFDSMRYGSRVVSRVLMEKLWNGDTLTKRDRILEIMLEEKERHQQRFPDAQEAVFSDEDVEHALQNIQEEVIGAFSQMVDNGVVPRHLMETIKFSPGEIEFVITNRNGGNALVEHDRAKLSMGTGAIKAYADDLISLLHLTEHGLTQKQVLKLSAIALFTHELAHQIEKKVASFAYNQARENEAWNELKQTYLIWDILVKNGCLQQIALAHRRHASPPFETDNPKLAHALHVEKFAISFQIFSLVLGLGKEGLPSDQVAHLITEYKQLLDNKRMAFVEIFSFMRKAGVPDDKINSVAQILETIATTHGMAEFSHFPKLQTIGYFAAYTPSEITKSLTDISAEIDNGSFATNILKTAAANGMRFLGAPTPPPPATAQSPAADHQSTSQAPSP